MNKKIKVSIVGGSGYTGIEVLRLISLHPNVDIHHITSRNDAGRFVCDIYPSLRGILSHKFVHPDEIDLAESNIVFFSTPNGIAMKYAKGLMENGVKIIGISNLTSTVSSHASLALSTNFDHWICDFYNKELKTIEFNFEDEIIKSSVLVHEGDILNERFK